jgi:tagatose 6-phosphate kinase
MILIVNLNLAVDQIIHLDGLKVGGVHRPEQVERRAGGKGVNIARVLQTLNERALLTGFLGGRAGDFIAGELQREGLASACTPIRQESRTCIILDDLTTHVQTVINEAGAKVSEAELRLFLNHYSRLLSTSDLVIVTGSLQPGLPADTYARLISLAHEMNKPVLLDTSQAPLSRGLQARPFIVKINGAEAGSLVGLRINDFDAAAEAASRLIARGARHAMITLGAEGAVLNYEGVEYRMKAPGIEARNSVGSGDAVAAGLAAGLMRGLCPEEMARLSVAAGSANAFQGAGRLALEEILCLMPEVVFL